MLACVCVCVCVRAYVCVYEVSDGVHPNFNISIACHSTECVSTNNLLYLTVLYFILCIPGWDLVTWSKDRTLRIWSISEQLRMDLGADPPDEDLIGEEMIDGSLDLSGQTVEMSSSIETEDVNIDQTSLQQDSSASPMVTRSFREGTLSSSLSRSPVKSLSAITRTDSSGSVKSSSGHQMFQPQVAHTLAQEFALLNLDNDSHLEIEAVSLRPVPRDLAVRCDTKELWSLFLVPLSRCPVVYYTYVHVCATLNWYRVCPFNLSIL